MMRPTFCSVGSRFECPLLCTHVERSVGEPLRLQFTAAAMWHCHLPLRQHANAMCGHQLVFLPLAVLTDNCCQLGQYFLRRCKEDQGGSSVGSSDECWDKQNPADFFELVVCLLLITPNNLGKYFCRALGTLVRILLVLTLLMLPSYTWLTLQRSNDIHGDSESECTGNAQLSHIYGDSEDILHTASDIHSAGSGGRWNPDWTPPRLRQ
eukprot:3852451-Amphidinium_carterae.1